jgi:ataxin-3
MTSLSIEYIGYSTFVVVPTDPENPLPQSDADFIATTLPRPTSSGPQRLSTVHTPQPPAGLEGEDFQLQAALQASLGGAGEVSWEGEGSSVTAGAVGTQIPSASMGFPPSSSPPPIPPPSTRPADQPTGNPVAASMTRNRGLLERMRQLQEAALREHYHDEVAHSEDDQPRDPVAASMDRNRSLLEQMRRQQEAALREHRDYHDEVAHLEDDQPRGPSFGAVGDEDEQMRRAIAESAEMAREQGRTQTGSESAVIGADPEAVVYTDERAPGRSHSDRVYDDEDAELQAALQASLGEGPLGFFSPDPSTETSPFTTTSAASTRSEVSSGALEDDDGEGDTATEETGSDTAERSQPPAVSIEEMRRRRLERFGG